MPRGSNVTDYVHSDIQQPISKKSHFHTGLLLKQYCATLLSLQDAPA